MTTYTESLGILWMFLYQLMINEIVGGHFFFQLLVLIFLLNLFVYVAIL